MSKDYRNLRTFSGAFALLGVGLAAVLAAPLVAGGAPSSPVTTSAVELTIGADDSPITFDSSTTISGRLKGAKVRSGVTVNLQKQTFPFTGDFVTTKTTTTRANGTYTFGNVAPTENSRFRAVSSSPETTSDTVEVEVAIKVVLRLSDSTPHKREVIRFSGTASPEHDGRTVYIQRKSHTGRWHSVKKTTLKDAGSELSRFSKRYRIRRDGTFRARVFHDSDHEDGTSREKHANVIRGG
jgi:hypothetical protein